MSEDTRIDILGIDIFTNDGIPKDSAILLTPKSTLRTWEMIMSITKIQFPEPETHLHYKWRMFKRWIKGIPRRIRYKIFPYYIIKIEDYEEDA